MFFNSKMKGSELIGFVVRRGKVCLRCLGPMDEFAPATLLDRAAKQMKETLREEVSSWLSELPLELDFWTGWSGGFLCVFSFATDRPPPDSCSGLFHRNAVLPFPEHASDPFPLPLPFFKKNVYQF